MGAIQIPAWVPKAVQAEIAKIAARNLTSEHRSILVRLAGDRRMKRVWAELCRKNRSDRTFVHPARRTIDLSFDAERRQDEAMAEVLAFTFTSATMPPKVSKIEEIVEEKNKLLHRAEVIREAANDLERDANHYRGSDPTICAYVSQYLEDVQALRRVAGRIEHIASEARGENDPMTIRNDRGDRTTRGFQIACAAHLEELFGARLDGVSTILTEVALDVKSSERVSRSAFSSQK